MNLQQCLRAASEIDENYLAPICGRISREESGKHLHHLRWMVEEMHNDMSENKAMRWLGYIQGVLVGVYGVKLEEMKELSRKASTD